MNSDQLILTVFETIANAASINSKNKPFVIQEELFLRAQLTTDQAQSIMHLLEDDYKCIRVIKWPEEQQYSQDLIDEAIATSLGEFTESDFEVDRSYTLRLMPKFQDVYYSLTDKKHSSDKVVLPKTLHSAGLFKVHKENLISYKGQPIELEPKQRIICALLISNYPRTVTIRDIFEHYWDDSKEHDERHLDSASESKLKQNIYDSVSRVRATLKKLDDQDHISSDRDLGYRFNP